jgi:hypothetical protein
MKSVGKLVYSPSSHLGNSQKWLVLMCDDAISEYYRCLFRREFPWKGKLTRPVWGAHVSIIRSEYIPKFHLWGLDNGKSVEFDYLGGVESNDEYYWLKVECPYLADLRVKYGLSPEPRFGFHLTIGRTTQNR